jgi:small subunit ribosomal protein S6e
MREDVAGASLTEIMLAERSTGYQPDRDGERRRVTVRGREVTEEVVQINAAVSEHGNQSVPVALGHEEPDDDSGGEETADDADGSGDE